MIPLEEEKSRLQKRIDKKIATFEKALEKAKKTLEESHRFDEARHMADLVKSHYGQLKKGMTELKVLDWAKENKDEIEDASKRTDPSSSN
jgi:predicted ribosome quality control (RQC) complex YloA/Tae2 family protein